jgi:hypothetical protein
MQKAIPVFLGFALFALGPTASIAGDKAANIDVTGIWAFEVDLGVGQGTPVFTFEQKGEKLTGTYHGQFGQAKVTGTVKGNKIEFSFDVQAGKAVYTGTIENDTMKGKANYADQASGTWTAKRKKDK